MGTDKSPKTLRVYVPAPDSELANAIWEGSGIVGSLAGETGRLRIDYEGAEEIYRSYADRVERAAERHLAIRLDGGHGYPSRASAHVDATEVIEVGRWDPAKSELTVTDDETLRAWLE